jgi:hypothetical protein
MTIRQAIDTIGAWAAALAATQPGSFRATCRHAAHRARNAEQRAAWSTLATASRHDITWRLAAAGIHLPAHKERPA